MPKDLASLKLNRGQHKAAVTRIQKYVEALSAEEIDSETIFQLRARLERLTVAYDKFDQVQSDIENLSHGEPAKLKEEEQIRESFDEAYYSTTAKIQMFISTAESDQARSPKTEQKHNSLDSRINLPMIDLPTFDGKYHNWISFRDRFKCLIDNKQNLTNIEKLHYLKASLKGEVASLLDPVDIAEENYQLAWNTLSDRFENKKLLIHNHIKALFEFPAIRKDVLPNLRKLVDEIKRNIFNLSKLGLDTENWDPLLLYLAIEKVDEDTRKEWEAKTCSIESPTLQEFYDFIANRCHYLEKIKDHKQGNPKSNTNILRKPIICKLATTKVSSKTSTIQPEQKPCPHCADQHSLFYCQKFLDMPISQRQELVNKLKLCFNCLRPYHLVKDCTARGCKKCGSRHNTTLHTETPNQSTSKNQPIVMASTTASQESSDDEILLSTAILHVKDRNGVQHAARVLLDSGSQGNFVTKEFSNKLQISSTVFVKRVQSINQVRHIIKEKVELDIESPSNKYQIKTNFMVIKKLSDNLPQSPLDITSVKIPESITLADPTFATPGKLDMLIGAPLFWELLCIGRIKLGNTGIVLRKTKLGWIVTGTLSNNQGNSYGSLSCNFVSLSDKIERFWNVEEVGFSTPRTEPEFERQFVRTLTRRSDGRFEVGLPLNSNVHQLGESYENAKRRLISLERRFTKLPKMKRQYQEFMDDYIRLGHMTRLPDPKTDEGPVFYLPHHGIIKESSITSSLRVVFDGSAKTTTGISLNDTLISGGVLQNELFSILLRFRKHSIVITSDIEKMYRQIYITPQHRNLQRILWRRNSEEPIETFQLNTVTYGTRAGSFLAIRCLEEVARRIKEEHPEVSKIISQDFYVDDLLTGGETMEEVNRYRDILTTTLGQYGFNLRKWNSNHAAIVQEIIQEQSQIKHLVIEGDISKTLGLMWSAQKDILSYAVKDDSRKECTKRAIMSSIAQIFYPLGIIGPVTVLAKILMQDIWKKRLDWDEPITGTIRERWLEFQTNWQHIKQFEIPRHVIVRRATTIIIHGFCDASESAYGACIYLSSVNESGEHATRLLCAKSKVAPLKLLTLPRLELCGAVLLSKLMTKIQGTMDINISTTYLWTDSKIVLAWISKTPDHWQTFVANRVAEIRRLTETYKWGHVSGKENPADIISRGMNASKLLESQLWWSGPTW